MTSTAEKRRLVAQQFLRSIAQAVPSGRQSETVVVANVHDDVDQIQTEGQQQQQQPTNNIANSIPAIAAINMMAAVSDSISSPPQPQPATPMDKRRAQAMRFLGSLSQDPATASASTPRGISRDSLLFQQYNQQMEDATVVVKAGEAPVDFGGAILSDPHEPQLQQTTAAASQTAFSSNDEMQLGEWEGRGGAAATSAAAAVKRTVNEISSVLIINLLTILHRLVRQTVSSEAEMYLWW